MGKEGHFIIQQENMPVALHGVREELKGGRVPSSPSSWGGQGKLGGHMMLEWEDLCG